MHDIWAWDEAGATVFFSLRRQLSYKDLQVQLLGGGAHRKFGLANSGRIRSSGHSCTTWGELCARIGGSWLCFHPENPLPRLALEKLG